MVLVYILLGIAFGTIAAVVTTLAGGGLLLAILAYIIGGMAGFVGGLVWLSAPKPERSEKQAVVQRS